MYIVTKVLKFCAAHRLYKYDGCCNNIHGHNYRVDVQIKCRALNQLGMVIDFGEIKEKLQTILDFQYDHKLILFKDDPMVKHFQSLTPVCIFPKNPTAENMVEVFTDEFNKVIGFPFEISVRVWETDTSYAEVNC
jgi:6-pyruvoyltetrahydropterin/6-carboxytetrahydropterin synthase